MSNLSKEFQPSRRQALTQIIWEGLGRRINRTTPSDGNPVWAVRDISFSIPFGQILGIVGDNGAGKTTLLRMMAGLSQPTSGEIRAQGRVSAMLGLITVLNPDLSGRNNIEASGIYYGHNWSRIKERLPGIVDFADLGEFIDHPVRTYSSGMQARLSFSIVTGFGFDDTLLIDEALGAGDARFAARATARMREIIQQGRTVVVVSHSMETIRSLCQRVIWLERGIIRMDGDPDMVIEAYRQTTSQKTEQKELARFKKNRKAAFFDILNVELQGKDGQSRSVYEPGEFLRVIIHYHSAEKLTGIRFRINMYRADGAFISTTSLPPDQDLGKLEGTGRVAVVFDPILLSQGAYFLKTVAETTASKVLVETQTLLHIEDPHFQERGGIPVLLPMVTWQWDR